MDKTCNNENDINAKMGIALLDEVNAITRHEKRIFNKLNLMHKRLIDKLDENDIDLDNTFQNSEISEKLMSYMETLKDISKEKHDILDCLVNKHIYVKKTDDLDDVKDHKHNSNNDKKNKMDLVEIDDFEMPEKTACKTYPKIGKYSYSLNLKAFPQSQH